MKNFFLRLLGLLSLALGAIGIFVPLLPTTPFLLLSSFLFMRSSQRLHSWLINHKILGKYIKDFQQEKKIALQVKVFSVSLLWISILISTIFFAETLWLKALLIAIAIGVTIHILHYKTKKQKK